MTKKRPTAGQIDKDFRPLVNAAIDEGWTFDVTGRTHYRLRSPDGEQVVYLPGSNSQRNHTRRLRGELRRAGLDV